MINDIIQNFSSAVNLVFKEKANLLNISFIPTLLVILINIASYLFGYFSSPSVYLILQIASALFIALMIGFVLINAHKYFLLKEKAPFHLKKLCALLFKNKAFFLIYMIPFLCMSAIFYSYISYIIMIAMIIYIGFLIEYPFIFPHLALGKIFDLERIEHLSNGYRMKVLISILSFFLIIFLIKTAIIIIFSLVTGFSGLKYFLTVIMTLIVDPILSIMLAAILCTYYNDAREKNGDFLVKTDQDVLEN